MADLRRSVDLMLKSAENLGYKPAAGSGGHQPPISGADFGAAAYSNAELARQLRTCMREICELRAELSGDREGRSQTYALQLNRVREELQVQFHSFQHTSVRDVREVEAAIKARMTERDVEAAADRKRLDEALRLAKSLHRDQFDAKEDMRESVDEMRGRVDAAVAMCTSAKAENTLELERERSSMQHRMDIELSRYSELYRKQQGEVEEAKRAMAREVERISSTIRNHVEEVWQDKLRAFSKHHADFEERTAGSVDQLRKDVNAATSELDTLSKFVRREIAGVQAAAYERLGSLEALQPVLMARVEKSERRVEGVLESNGKMSALLDVFREASDKTSALASRAAERLRVLEDAMSDRDVRLASAEAQMLQMTGVESFRMELEALKRTVSRLDHSIDATVKAADRSERAAEDSRRLVDTAVEKCESADKKTTRFATKMDAMEQRLTQFSERFVILEDASEKHDHATARAEQSLDALSSRATTVEARVASASDRVDNSTRELRQKVAALESTIGDSAEAIAKASETADVANRELDKTLKKLGKLETTVFNFAENNHSLKSASDAVGRTVDVLMNRTESLERSIATLSAANVNAQEILRHVPALKARVEEAEFGAHPRAAIGGDDAARELVRSSERKTLDGLDALRRSLEAKVEDLQRNVDQVQRSVPPPSRDQGQEIADLRREIKTMASKTELSETAASLRGRLTAVEESVSQLQRKQQAAPPKPTAEAGDLSPTFRSNFTLGDDDDTDDTTSASAHGMRRAQAMPSRTVADHQTSLSVSGPAAAAAEPQVAPAVSRPPLAPNTTTTVATAVGAASVLVPKANPYQTDDSERSGSVMSQSLPQRQRPAFSTTSSADDSSPDRTDSQAPKPSQPRADSAARSIDDSEDSTPDRPISRVLPKTANPFQHSPSDDPGSEVPVQQTDEQRERIRLSLQAANNPFASTPAVEPAPKKKAESWDDTDDEDDHIPTADDVTPQHEPVRASAPDAGVAPAPVATKPVAEAQPSQVSGDSPASSKATADMTISLLSSATGGARSATAPGQGVAAAAEAKPEAKPGPRTSAWNFDADEDEEDDEEEEPLDDDALAGIM